MTNQEAWVERARQVLPAATFGNFEAEVIIREGKGARVWDENGKEYVDYLIGSGPMILGHGHEEVLEAVRKKLEAGTTFFANNTTGIELAEEICKAMACAQMVRFVSTGSEADMYAMRLARAYTGRDKIVKFEGGYHGMSAEGQMSLAPEKLVNFPNAVPDSAGIPDGVREQVLVAPFNDAEFITSLLNEYGSDVAGIIVEPMQRLIPPVPGFLQALRDECDKHGIVLIFDEVVTGFRMAYGGAQSVYGVTPDLCTLGKVIGGGFPLAAIAGKADIMNHFDKSKAGEDGFLMQVGTLSGNPVASAAGLKTMEILNRNGQYDHYYKTGERLQSMVRAHLDKSGVPYQIVGHETLFDVVFTGGQVFNHRDMLKANKQHAAIFNKTLREHGVLKPGGKIYVSLALTDEDLAVTDAALDAAATALAAA